MLTSKPQGKKGKMKTKKSKQLSRKEENRRGKKSKKHENKIHTTVGISSTPSNSNDTIKIKFLKTHNRTIYHLWTNIHVT